MKTSEQCMSKGRGRGRPRKILKTAPSSLKKNVVGQSNARVTRSKAANIWSSSVTPINHDAITDQNQNQLVRASAAKCTKQTPDVALKPVSIATAADDITKGTKGVASNSPKLTAVIRCVGKNGASSPKRDKQAADECIIDENSPHGKQGSCPPSDSSRNCNPSNEFERVFLRPAGEDDDGLQPRLLTLPSPSTQYVENVLPCEIEKTGLHTTHSFNFTEMAAMMNDHRDDEQAVSSVDPALTNVEGYLVKKEVAPMLERIFKKYNNIARECIIKTPTMVVQILETVCSYCQKLESTGLTDTMENELEDMAVVVEKYQQMGFDVRWLIERLEDFSKRKRLMKYYPTLKVGKLKTEMKEKEVNMLKQKLSIAKAELATMKVEDDKKNQNFDEQMNALKVKGLHFWGKSPLYGLF